MADVRILTPQELQEREQKPAGRIGRRSEERIRIIEAYKAALQHAQPGYGGDVVLEEGEQKRVVRNNLKEAAKALNLALEFRPIRDPSRLHFRVKTLEEPPQPEPEPPPAPEPEPEPEPPRRRGRKRST